ncbi:MAG: hypothetical protein WAM70_11865 [Pyrinomonadaceae bacterium]
MTDEVWESIADAFANDPAAAFILAQVLFEIRKQIKKGRVSKVIESLDTGIEKLYPFTDDHKAAYKLYLLSVAGNLKPKHDPTLIVKEL